MLERVSCITGSKRAILQSNKAMLINEALQMALFSGVG